MKEPIPILEFRSDVAAGGRAPEPVIMELPMSKANTHDLAQLANDLATAGRTRILYAETPLYWQSKLSRALIAGFVFGVIVTMGVAFIWP